MHIDDIPIDSFFTFIIHPDQYIYLKLTKYTFISYIDYKSIEKRSIRSGAYTMNTSLLDYNYAHNVQLLQSIIV